VKPVTKRQNVTCHTGLHNVICHSTQVNTLRFNQLSILDLLSSDGPKTVLNLVVRYIGLMSIGKTLLQHQKYF